MTYSTQPNVLAATEVVPLTPQQVFDNALFGVRGQRYERSVVRSSLDIRPSCAYRGDNGLKCGIGFSIPDSVYDAAMDDPGPAGGTGITNLLWKEEGHPGTKPLATLFRDCRRSMLQEIQDAHDGMCFAGPGTFEADMKRIAGSYGLNYTKPDGA